MELAGRGRVWRSVPTVRVRCAARRSSVTDCARIRCADRSDRRCASPRHRPDDLPAMTHVAEQIHPPPIEIAQPNAARPTRPSH